MNETEWLRLFERLIAKPGRVSALDLDKLEALEPLVKDDPTYVMLRALAEGHRAYEKAQAFHALVPGSGIATLRVLIDDGLAKHEGDGRVIPTRAGRRFLAEETA